jgi:hypothetical protein
MRNSPNVSSSVLRAGRTLFPPTAPELDISTPEKRLAFAVLSDAVRHVQHGGIGGADDEAWLASDAMDHPFAFLAICEVLGLDASCIRRGVRRLRRATPHAHAA